VLPERGCKAVVAWPDGRFAVARRYLVGERSLARRAEETSGAT
jgi:hypothetical protein